MSGTGVGAAVTSGVALALASGVGLREGATLAKVRTGKAKFKAKTTKNNRKVSFRMEN